MKTVFLSTPSTISINDIKQGRAALSSKDYRIFKASIHGVELNKLAETYYVGREIGSEAYMQRSKYRFLKTKNLGKNYLLDENSIEYCKPDNIVHPKTDDILIAKDGGGDGLGDVVLYTLDNSGETDSVSAGILGVRVPNKDVHYVLGALKTNHFKNFVDLKTPQGSTIRHSKKVALDYFVPIPSTVNHDDPKLLKDYISALVKNIVSKEAFIKSKVARINQYIEEELTQGQNGTPFVYKQPTLQEVKSQWRLDTGLYKYDFKKIDWLISTYQYSFTTIGDNAHSFISGSTPPNYIENTNGKYWWIAVADISYGLIYSKLKTINLPASLNNTLQDGDILITRKGATLGKMNMYFSDELPTAFVNEDIKVLRFSHLSLQDKIFIGMFLNSKFGKTKLLSVGSKGTKQGLTNGNITSVKVPNFPDEIKQKIANEYYKKVQTINSNNLSDYLATEMQRNAQLGVFQLNMELFALRRKLEDIYQGVVLGEKIEIDLT